jgi:uroporphyrinogen decarboxylase
MKELLYATEVYLENHLLPFLDNIYREIGPYIDVAYCVGDDMATQLGPSFNLDLYRKYFKPMHRKIIETTKKRTRAKIMFHICGAAYPYLSDLVEIGVDVINPVQNNAAGMEEKKLKRDFGRDLSFWGAIDTQNVLSTGSREQVALENIIAMYETAHAQRG